MTDDSLGSDSVVLVESRQRDLDGQDRRLDNHGVVDLGLSLALAKFRQQGPPSEFPKEAIDFFHRLAKDRFTLHPLLAHAGPLAPLAGENETQLWLLLASDRRRESFGIDLAVSKPAEFVLHFLRSLADDRHEMRVMAASCEGGKGNIGEPLSCAAQKVGMPQRQRAQRIALGRTEHIQRRARGRLSILGN